MKDQNAKTNVIQFPTGPRKPAAEPVPAPAIQPSSPEAAPVTRPASRTRTKTLVGGIAAIALASFAGNRLNHQAGESSSASRAVASVEVLRDAAWEKTLAEKLAHASGRGLASGHVGTAPTLEQRLRLGTLEEKYTITFAPRAHVIERIELQGGNRAQPMDIADRTQFLNEYAALFDANSARLKSVEAHADGSVESYTLLDQNAQAKGEALIELDREQRLLSVKVQPAQI